jgi:hypothetical protein
VLWWGRQKNAAHGALTLLYAHKQASLPQQLDSRGKRRLEEQSFAVFGYHLFAFSFSFAKKREKRERKAFFIIISDFIFGFNAKESEVRRATHLITSLLVLVREVKTKNSSRPHPVILCDNQDRKQSPYCLIVR